MKFTFQGSIEKGHKLDFPRDRFKRCLLAFNEGQLVTITIAVSHKDRSLSQNSYYWGVVIQYISDFTGYEPNELHDELKRKFNPQASRLTNGETYGGSTTKLSTGEFKDYVERIVRWAAMELHVFIPDPNEVEA